MQWRWKRSTLGVSSPGWQNSNCSTVEFDIGPTYVQFETAQPPIPIALPLPKWLSGFRHCLNLQMTNFVILGNIRFVNYLVKETDMS